MQVSRTPAAVEDCLCALQWIARNAETYGFDLDRIVTSGHSAGGHLALTTAMVPASSGLALECATTSFTGPTAVSEVEVAAVVNWYGITDVADLAAGPNTKGYAVQWLGGLLDRDEVADPVVPYSHATRLQAALDAAGVANELHTVPGGGHGNFNRDETIANFEQIQDFLGSHGLSPARRRPRTTRSSVMDTRPPGITETDGITWFNRRSDTC